MNVNMDTAASPQQYFSSPSITATASSPVDHKDSTLGNNNTSNHNFTTYCMDFAGDDDMMAMDDTSSSTLSYQEQLDAINYYGYSQGVEGSSIENDKPVGMSFVPGSPLPADRLARKQRNFPRRGGFVHNSLLRSAVYAASDINNQNNNNNNNPALSLPPGDMTNSKISPRKRMRRTDHATCMPAAADSSASTIPKDPNFRDNTNNNGNDEAVIARATDLLEQLYLNNNKSNSSSTPSSSPTRPQQPIIRHGRRGGRRSDFLNSLSGHSNDHPQPPHFQIQHEVPFERSAPVRRVSRRTSYSSQISAGTDYDDDLDEFH